VGGEIGERETKLDAGRKRREWKRKWWRGRGGGGGSGSDKRAYVLLPPRIFSNTMDFILTLSYDKIQEENTRSTPVECLQISVPEDI